MGTDGTERSASGGGHRGPRTRLLVESPLHEDAGIELGVTRAHYLRNVLRLAPGAPVALFNGRDGEWQARIEGFGKQGCRVRAEQRLRPPDPPDTGDLWLLFAPVKRAGVEWLVEKATELGVTRLLPVVTRHTDQGRLNLERLAAIAAEAAEQCERLTVPELVPPQPLAAVLGQWPAGRPLLACCEAGPVRPLGRALAALPPGGPGAVLVGPEGGFATFELDELQRHPLVVAVGLGPRVLRAETAALAAIACWQAWCGDRSAVGASDRRPPGRADLSPSG